MSRKSKKRVVDVRFPVAEGDTGRLRTLRFVLAPGSPGLWPHPDNAYAAVSSTFEDALSRAWTWASAQDAHAAEASVRWLLVHDGGDPRASGGSAGGAAAVGLAYLLGLTKTRRSLDQRAAISATVTTDGLLGSVDQLPAKLTSEGRGWRLLVVSDSDEEPAAQARQGTLPRIKTAGDVRAAATLMARPRFSRRRVLGTLTALVVIASVLTWRFVSDRSASQNRANLAQSQAAALTSPVKAAVEVRTWAQTPAGTGPLTLILEPMPGRQPGLWRAPSAGLTVTGDLFLSAARTAWTWAVTSGALPPDASVRWRLRDPRTVLVTQVTGDSAGLAFAVGLRQVSSSRPRLTALDPTTSYLGTTDRNGRVLAPTSTPPLILDETSKQLRYLVTPPHWASNPAQPRPNLKIRTAPDADRAVTLGRRPVQVRRGRIRTHRAGKVSDTLPSPVTSVLLAPSGDAYAITAAAKLYGFDDHLRPGPGAIGVPVGSQLALRPSATLRELTESGTQTEPRAPELVLTESNAALILPDDPAQFMRRTSNNLGDSQVEPPLSNLGSPLVASDGTGSTAAMVDANGQIRVSSFGLPPTTPAAAVTYTCALLSNPSAEWRADYAQGQSLAGLLPPVGPCLQVPLPRHATSARGSASSATSLAPDGDLAELHALGRPESGRAGRGSRTSLRLAPAMPPDTYGTVRSVRPDAGTPRGACRPDPVPCRLCGRVACTISDAVIATFIRNPKTARIIEQIPQGSAEPSSAMLVWPAWVWLFH